MNVLIVGVNTKIASVFKIFSNVIILNIDNDYRKYKEVSDYNIINVSEVLPVVWTEKGLV